MNLQEALDIYAPIIWVVSGESARVYDAVINSARDDKTIYRFDPVLGLTQYDEEKSRWLRTLARVEGELRPVFEPMRAVRFVHKHKGLMIVDHAHMEIEKLLHFYSGLSYEFRQNVTGEPSETIPAQFILISHQDTVPPEIARDTVRVTLDLPEAEEIASLMERFDTDINPEAKTSLTKAAQGLAEVEVHRAFSLSLRKNQDLDPVFVGRIKIDTIKQGGLLDIVQPSIGLDQIGGLDKAKDLINSIQWTWEHREKAEELGITPPRRLLLVGISGSGKSAVCEAIAKTLGLELARTGIASVMNKFVGESEARMRQMFAQVNALKPIVLWVDEFGRDMSGGQSSSVVDGGTTDRVHGEFLTGLQELNPDILFVGAANRIEGLPPEMLRADRFDKIMFVGFPSFSERKEIFKIHLLQAFDETRDNEFDLDLLAKSTPFFTGAEIKTLIKYVNFTIGTSKERRPETSEYVIAAPHMKGRVWKNHKEACVAMYAHAVENWDWASSEQEAEAKGLDQQAKQASKQQEVVEKPKESKTDGFSFLS